MCRVALCSRIGVVVQLALFQENEPGSFLMSRPPKQQQEIKKTIPDTIFLSLNDLRRGGHSATFSCELVVESAMRKDSRYIFYFFAAVGMSCAEGVGDRRGQGMGRSAENRLDPGVKAGRLG